MPSRRPVASIVRRCAACVQQATVARAITGGDTYPSSTSASGEGLPAGLALDVNFKSPHGDVFSTAAMDKVVVVDPSGASTFEITPSTEFNGQPARSWLVQVCVTGTDQCVRTDFDISQ